MGVCEQNCKPLENECPGHRRTQNRIGVLPLLMGDAPAFSPYSDAVDSEGRVGRHRRCGCYGVCGVVQAQGDEWTSAGVLAVALYAAKRKKNADSPTIQCSSMNKNTTRERERVENFTHSSGVPGRMFPLGYSLSHYCEYYSANFPE